MGVGVAHLRHPDSVDALPALQVASYAVLLLATLRSLEHAVHPHLLPVPKWAADTAPTRFSTQRAIHQLRTEVWGRGLGVSNFSSFATLSTPNAKPEKFAPDIRSAVLFAVN